MVAPVAFALLADWVWQAGCGFGISSLYVLSQFTKIRFPNGSSYKNDHRAPVTAEGLGYRSNSATKLRRIGVEILRIELDALPLRGINGSSSESNVYCNLVSRVVPETVGGSLVLPTWGDKC
jgi:hypothetical protein